MRWFAIAPLVAAAACGSFGSSPSDAGAGGGDANTPDDAAPFDATSSPGSDASTDAKLGADANAKADGGVCPAGELYCRATETCLKTCVSCPAAPIECVRCDATQKNPRGTCEAFDAGAFCLNASYAPGAHCDCDDTLVANCLSPQHVCLAAGSTDWCVTCGENGLATNGKPCKGGGTCNATRSPPGCE